MLSNNKNKLLVHMYVVKKHNYIPYITFTITTVQLHVSAINVGHLQVVHEAPYDKLYLHLSGGTVCVLYPHSSVDIVVFLTTYICTNNLFWISLIFLWKREKGGTKK